MRFHISTTRIDHDRSSSRISNRAHDHAILTPVLPVSKSANRHRLIVPRCRLNTYDRRVFPAAGPTVWNTLRDELRDPACDVDSFKQFFRTILFSFY